MTRWTIASPALEGLTIKDGAKLNYRALIVAALQAIVIGNSC